MNILVIGNGGREYSIASSLRIDPRVGRLFFSPPNEMATLLMGAESFGYESKEELLANVLKNDIELVIIGPEAPLMGGVSDFLMTNGVSVFGPSLENARLEGSKVFMKGFASRYGIPTANFKVVNDECEVDIVLGSMNMPVVLKADGLCSGKGVIIASSLEEARDKAKEMLDGSMFGDAGKSIVIEEFLEGYELSVFAISDGKRHHLLPVCQDHKRLLDNDLGPNTGGMGAYSPVPEHLCDKSLLKKIDERVFIPTFKALRNDNSPYVGVLFAGIMVVNGDPYLLEFNTRFGDPECETIVPGLKTPLLDVLMKTIEGKLEIIEFDNLCRVCVVLASRGYPWSVDTGEDKVVIEVGEFDQDIGDLIYANVSLVGGKMYANRGRVVMSVGKGASLQEAKDNAYKIVSCIHFEGMQYRTDIGSKAFSAPRNDRG